MLDSPRNVDVLVIGGGAAGLMAAFTAAKRGKQVTVLEVSNKLGKKILMSGGGRCNFTNLEISANNFICKNPHFVKSALAQYTQWDFIGMIAKHGIAYHEKDHGQLFCDHSSKDVLKMLTDECEEAGVELRLNCEVQSVTDTTRFIVATNQGQFRAESLIVASGGLSIPSLGGATGLGYRLAKQFGLEVLPTRASLVPLTLSGKWQEISSALSGVSLPVVVSVPTTSFAESMLFTHRGISGPAILQLSNYWELGNVIEINLLPNENVAEILIAGKNNRPNTTIQTILKHYLPKSLLIELQAQWWPDLAEKTLHQIKSHRLRTIGDVFNQWQLKPSGTEGYRTAEVTMGGIAVESISSKTLSVKHRPELFFIGEALDVTGHLGGYNFQWAWSSGYVAGKNA